MNRSTLLAMSVLFAFLISLGGDEAFSRGFGGGGFRGGGFGGGGFRGGGFEGGGWGGGWGHAYRGGGTVYHIPSMSMQSRSFESQSGRGYSRPLRSSSPERSMERRPDAGFDRFQGTGMQKPSEAQLQRFLNLPRHDGGGFADLGKIGVGAAAGALGQAGVRDLLGSPRAAPGDRPGILDRHGLGDRPTTLPSRPRAEQIRDNFQHAPDHPFTPRWWRNHPNMAWAYWDHFGKYNYGWNHWWRPATWAGLVAWIAGASWVSPTYYDYGQDIYYQGDEVYSGGQPVSTGQEYYQQASNLATAAPALTQVQLQSDSDLLPLGVFAVSQGDATDSNTILQLAVSKDGVITGMYYNMTSDTARPVKGMVDKKTQRAAWTFADGRNIDIIMETGIYNLTQDQTQALVHFGKDKTQQWLMVRLQQPQSQQPAGQQG